MKVGFVIKIGKLSFKESAKTTAFEVCQTEFLPFSVVHYLGFFLQTTNLFSSLWPYFFVGQKAREKGLKIEGLEAQHLCHRRAFCFVSFVQLCVSKITNFIIKIERGF